MVGRMLLVFFGSLLSLASVSSCSSDEAAAPSGQGGAAGTGGEAPEDASTEPDVAKDVANEPEVSAPVCPDGTWGNVPMTACDLIAQDCELGLTCVPSYENNVAGTKCLATNNGFKTRGETCAKASECAAGLRCIFGYCGPYCCKEAQDAICGPGGRCNVTIGLGDTGKYGNVCSYLKPCTLWAGECASDQGCQVMEPDGSGACVPPAGSSFVNEGEPCESLNDCGDDMICLGGFVASTCRYLCMRSKPPWLAEMPSKPAPGQGGCPEGQACDSLDDKPAWLGVCKP